MPEFRNPHDEVAEQADEAAPPNGAAGAPQGPTVPGARERGRMRRRLRRQQRVREALLLDLGALVYELHRQNRREPELLQAKAAELTVVDREVRALADALESQESIFQLVAAGIAGSCPNCGALLTTDARFCSSCGASIGRALNADRERPEVSRGGNGAGVNGGERSHELSAQGQVALGAAAEQPNAPAGNGGAPRGFERTSTARALRALQRGSRRAREWLGNVLPPGNR
jgi:hypothetical protein